MFKSVISGDLSEDLPNCPPFRDICISFCTSDFRETGFKDETPASFAFEEIFINFGAIGPAKCIYYLRYD
jgi:hypothetical protein